MGAREIAEELGITRNAVYQQIQRLRKHGELDPGFTPTGQPPREQVPGADVLQRLVRLDPSITDSEVAATAGSLALINEMRYTRDQLSAIVARLSSLLPS
jgi:transposase